MVRSEDYYERYNFNLGVKFYMYAWSVRPILHTLIYLFIPVLPARIPL